MKSKMIFLGLEASLLISGILLAVIQICNSMPANFTTDFENKCSVKIPQNGVEIKTFVSKRTGIRIVVANADGPVIQTALTLATEPEGYYGFPHSLEHLIFSGSERYPYQGVLNKMVGRKALSIGVGAFTKQDHTGYIMMSSGSEAVPNTLPVILDHILYPLLSESAFTTEIYHVTGSGEDAGVVYSEQRGLVSISWKFRTLLQAALYPLPSNYAFPVLSDFDIIRNNLTIEKIRAYHKTYYRPENIQISVIGRVDEEELLAAVHEYEENILSKGPRPAFKRFWQSPITPLNQSVRMNHFYPSSDEKRGAVFIGFKGNADYNENVALKIFLKYLVFGAGSTLRKTFLEGSDPITTEISLLPMDYSEQAFIYVFDDVEQERMDEVEGVLESSLQNLYNLTEEFPTSSIRGYIEHQITKLLYRLENAPGDLAEPIYNFGLYGNTCEDLDKRVNFLSLYEALLQKNTSYWRGLLKNGILDLPKVVLTARPSIAEANKIQRENKERIEKRRQDLGPEGLVKKSEELKEAMKMNEVPPPPSLLDDIPTASVNEVTLHPLMSYSNVQTVNNHNVTFNSNSPYFDIGNLSFKFNLDDVNSNFIFLTAILDSSSLNSSQKLYLPLLTDLIFQSDVIVNGTNLMSNSEVKQALQRDFFKTATSIGLGKNGQFSCSFCNYVMLYTRMEIDKYQDGVAWLYDVMYHSRFTIDRVKAKIYYLLLQLGTYKTQDDHISDYISSSVLFQTDSNLNLFSFARQEKFLTDLSERMESEEKSQEVIKELQSIFSTLTDVQTTSFHMSTNLKKLANTTDVMKPWEKFQNRSTTRNLNLNVLSNTQFRRELKLQCKTLTENDHMTPIQNSTVNSNDSKSVKFTDPNCSITAYIINSTDTDSTFAKKVVNTIDDLSDDDLPALEVAKWYLMQPEGPLYNAVRAEGFAYSVFFDLEVSQGTLSLVLYRASQPAAAYESMITTMNNYKNGTVDWNSLLLDNARSSILYRNIYYESDLSDVTWKSLRSYYNNKTPTRDFLNLVSEVSLDDVKRVFHKYLLPLLSPEDSVSIFVCPTNDIEKLNSTLSRMGHRVKIVNELKTLQFD